MSTSSYHGSRLVRLLFVFGAVFFCFLTPVFANPRTEPDSAVAQRIIFHLMPFPETTEGESVFPELKLRHSSEGRLLPFEMLVGQNAALVRKPARGLKIYPQAIGDKLPSQMPALAEADFPASWKTVLILVAAKPDASELRLKVFNVGEDVLPYGKIGFINQTSSQLAGRLLSGPRGKYGNVEFTVSPGSVSICDAKVSPGNETQSALMTLMQLEKDSKWTRVANESIGLDLKGRTLGILFPRDSTSLHIIWFTERNITSDSPDGDSASVPKR